MNRPICINKGCGRYCIPSIGSLKKPNEYIKFRPYCSRCFRANSGLTSLPSHITAFQKHKCSNLNGKLGFPCIIGKEGHRRIKKIGCTKQMFQLDHIDGNSLNNTPENVQELCCMCHKHKSIRNNDYSTGIKKNKKKRNCNKSKMHIELHYRRPTLSEHTWCSRGIHATRSSSGSRG